MAEIIGQDSISCVHCLDKICLYQRTSTSTASPSAKSRLDTLVLSSSATSRASFIPASLTLKPNFELTGTPSWRAIFVLSSLSGAVGSRLKVKGSTPSSGHSITISGQRKPSAALLSRLLRATYRSFCSSASSSQMLLQARFAILHELCAAEVSCPSKIEDC